MALSATATITGDPIGTDEDPNSATPPLARQFSAPASTTPQTLYVATVDGRREDGNQGFAGYLWWKDPASSRWYRLPDQLITTGGALVLNRYPWLFEGGAALFLQITTVFSPDLTQVVIGFGLGPSA